jgi:hypothetical protein
MADFRRDAPLASQEGLMPVNRTVAGFRSLGGREQAGGKQKAPPPAGP